MALQYYRKAIGVIDHYYKGQRKREKAKLFVLCGQVLLKMQQPQQGATGNSYETRRVDVRLAQSLHLPLDLKLLLGLELGRATNSPVLLDAFDPINGTRKYIGGVAVNF